MKDEYVYVVAECDYEAFTPRAVLSGAKYNDWQAERMGKKLAVELKRKAHNCSWSVVVKYPMGKLFKSDSGKQIYNALEAGGQTK